MDDEKQREELREHLIKLGLPEVYAYLISINANCFPQSRSISDCINWSMNWERTPEGYDFWDGVFLCALDVDGKW